MQTQTIGPILGITAGTDPNLLITHGDERVIRYGGPVASYSRARARLPPSGSFRGLTDRQCARETDGHSVWDRRTLDQVRIIPVKEAVTSLERSRGGSVLTSAAGSVVAIRDATTYERSAQRGAGMSRRHGR